mmetsp:Transcript_13023/g.33244  ORF Transcript_13023/g.33244 Transcript_13023/m.33244 type:complete len:448 (-) Transcript_13023:710-2053(-)
MSQGRRQLAPEQQAAPDGAMTKDVESPRPAAVPQPMAQQRSANGRLAAAAPPGGLAATDLPAVALVDHQLEAMIDDGAFRFSGSSTLRKYVQPASIDIPVGRRCVLLREKVLPFRKRMDALLSEEDLVLEERTLEPNESVLLLKGQTYLFHCGTVSLGSLQYGSLSPKSSIGRVDLMVRGVFDECGLYDTILGAGELWMEVSPRSFNVRVACGQALSQLMVFEHRPRGLPDRPVSPLAGRPALSFDHSGNELPLHVHRGALVLSLNLNPDIEGVASQLSSRQSSAESGAGHQVGFEALPTSAVVDLARVGEHNPADYFRPIFRAPGRSCVTLEKDKFYILSTKERVCIPIHLSAEMVPFSQHVGELRAHYAGFFDPGFGYGRAGEVKGTVGVLEVRPHETITVYDGQPICLMEFFNNADIPARPYGHAANNYHRQTGPKLAKYFASP